MNLSPDGQKLLGEVFKWEVVRRSSIGRGGNGVGGREGLTTQQSRLHQTGDLWVRPRSVGNV